MIFYTFFRYNNIYKIIYRQKKINSGKFFNVRQGRGMDMGRGVSGYDRSVRRCDLGVELVE